MRSAKLFRVLPTRSIVAAGFVVLALIVASLVPYALRVAEASSGPISQNYTLVAQTSGQCLDVAGGSTADGANIQQFPCHRYDNQAFEVDPVAISPAGKYFRLKIRKSGKCLDVAGASTASGANVLQWSCHGGQNQIFSRVSQQGGGYHLIARHSGMCLNVAGASTASGANIEQAVCATSATSQRFRMARSYAAGTGAIPIHTFKTFSLTDRASIRVNLTSGNLLYANADIGGLERAWNSLSTDNATELGYGWTLNLGRDTYLAADCTKQGPQASMAQLFKFDFVKQANGAYTAPTGLDLDLANTSPTGTACESEKWQLTSQDSRASMTFSGPAGPRRYLTQVSDTNGNNLTIAYTTVSGVVRTVSATDSRGHTVTYVRNAAGTQVTALRDFGGRTESFVYDASGRLIRATDPAGKATTYGYNTNNLITSITDPNGNVITIEYDPFRRVSAIRQGGLKWAFGYDLDASSVCSTSTITPPLSRTYVVPPDFHTATFCRDDEGRPRETRDGHNERVIHDYDANSNVTRTGWLDSQASSVFDAQSRRTSTTDATGATTSTAYGDPANPFLPTAQTNEQRNTYGLGYDSRGQTTRITDPAGNAQTYTYTSNGQVGTTTDQRGQVTSYSYDSAGRLVTFDPPGTAIGTETYTYDSLNRVATVTDGRGQRTTMTYDNMDRTTRLTYADGSFVSYAYDGNGNTASSQDASGTTSYTFDAFNRLKTETAPGESTITYGYDLDGMLVSYADAGGTTKYVYGDGQRLQKVTEPNGAVTTYQTETAPQNPRSFHPDFPVVTRYPNGVSVTQTPDLAGRIATMRVQRSNGPDYYNRGYSYQHPVTGKQTDLLQTETDNVAGTSMRYTYDSLDRLVRARTTRLDTGAAVNDFSYKYDAAGNRTTTTSNGSTVTETSNNANQLTARGKTSFGYDTNGNLTSSSAGFSASYNAANQTTSMRGASGATVATSYTGVGQSRLSALGGQTITNTGLGITRVGGDRFTRGPDGRLISMRTPEGETHYFLTDPRGSVIGLVGPAVIPGSFDPCAGDTGGGEIEPCIDPDPAALTTFAYADPFGAAGATSGYSPAAQRNPFRFTGALYSPALGLYKMGERWYDPALGRWTQADPLVQPFSPREANRYGYASADPINLTDPSGLMSYTACKFLLTYGLAVASGTGGLMAGQLLFGAGSTNAVYGAILLGPLGPALGIAIYHRICGPEPPSGGSSASAGSPSGAPSPAPEPTKSEHPATAGSASGFMPGCA